LVRNQDNVSE